MSVTIAKKLSDEKFPLRLEKIPKYIKATIDHDEWVYPQDRKGG